MENRLENLANDLNKILHSNVYQFEIDTEDFVFGFKKTIRKRTKDLAKAFKLEQKVTKDCGRFLSDTVRIVAVRMYKNGDLKKELHAEEITAVYNG